MNELFAQKYDNEEWVEDEYPWKQYRRKGYGFIYIKNPNYPMEERRVSGLGVENAKQLTVFTWFDENILIGDLDIDENTVDQVFILGDFTTK